MRHAENFSRWLHATRPRTWPLALSPVFAGLALAWVQTGTLAWHAAVGTLWVALAIQIGTNLHNDAADFERGTDTAERLGPVRAAAAGWFSVQTVRRAAHLAFASAFTIGLLLVISRGGWPLLALGAAAITAGYAYTGGAKPIAYGPLGELYVVAFFGLAAVAGTAYLQTGTVSGQALLIGFALGLPAAAVLLLNNYRDFASDQRAGRNTLCHVLGRARARWLYTLLLLVPLLVLTGGLVWLALPLALWLLWRLWRGADGRALNPLLAHTALYQSAVAGLLVLDLLFNI